MNVHFLGIIWSAINLYCFKSRKKMIYIILLSIVLSSASLFEIGGKSILPFLFSSIVFIIRYIIDLYGNKKIQKSNLIFLSFVFFVILTISTFLAPIIFDDVYVVSHRENNYTSTVYTDNISISNIEWMSLLTLLLYLICGFIIYQWREEFTSEEITKIITYIIWIEILSCILIQLFYSVGKVDLIANILFTNKNTSWMKTKTFYYVNKLVRWQGTFTEPSVAGPFFVGLFWYSLYGYKKRKYIVSFLLLLASVLNLSTTTFLCFIFSFLFVLLFRKKYKIVLYGIPILGISIWVLNKLGLLEFASKQLINKFQAGNNSFAIRIQWDLLSFKIFKETFLGGIGYCASGSNSLLFAILMQTGILGLGLIVIIIYMIWIDLSKKDEGIILLFISIIIGMNISCGSFVFPPIWIAIYIVLLSYKKGKYLC